MCFESNTKGKDMPKGAVFEVAQIFSEFGNKYQSKHPLPIHYKNIMNDIEKCRTEYFGGHVDSCDICCFERINYNSCRTGIAPNVRLLLKRNG